jgi:hypothetical protein
MGADLTLALSPPGEGPENSSDLSAVLPVLPTDARVTHCATAFKVTQLTFSGAGALALRALSPLIKAAVARELDRALCASLAVRGAAQLSAAGAYARPLFCST